jgi:hypothetical protein
MPPGSPVGRVADAQRSTDEGFASPSSELPPVVALAGDVRYPLVGPCRRIKVGRRHAGVRVVTLVTAWT